MNRFAILNDWSQVVDDTDDPGEARQLLREGKGHTFAYCLVPGSALEDVVRFLARRAQRINRMREICSWKREALRRDPHCAFCRRRLTIRVATAEHLTPVSKGGDDSPGNLVLACHDCNQLKGDSTLEEFRERLRSGILFSEQAAHVPDQPRLPAECMEAII